MPPMTQVHSTHVDRVGYDAATQELHITWKNGKTSVYSGVPAQTADAARTAWSVGQFVQSEIIPNFPHRYEG